jgi:hypothetical protein
MLFSLEIPTRDIRRRRSRHQTNIHSPNTIERNIAGGEQRVENDVGTPECRQHRMFTRIIGTISAPGHQERIAGGTTRVKIAASAEKARRGRIIT